MGNDRQQNDFEIPVKKMFEPLVKKAFPRKFIIVFRKKGNKLKFMGKSLFTKGLNVFYGNFSAILLPDISGNLTGIFLIV